MKDGHSPLIFTVDSYANGISFGQHTDDGQDIAASLRLRLENDDSQVRLRSRYVLHKKNPLHELELHLMRLSKQGMLSAAQIYFGVSSDPFYPFDDKFDASMKFLELFKRYTPGQLIVQTRSPLLVIALPVLNQLGRHASVTFGLESCDEEIARKFTPGFPRISERLDAVRTLRRFGVEVTLQVAPILPYGDWRQDATAFAKILADNSDYVSVVPLNNPADGGEQRLKTSSVARALFAARKFHWLRPDAAKPLLNALDDLAPEKLHRPSRDHLGDKQLDIFAA